MKTLIFSSSCFFLLPLFSVLTINAQDTFRGLIPFVTSRIEVEKKLGKPDEFGRYEFDEGTVRVLYRQTVCEKTDTSCLCLAPVNTVLQIVVQPDRELKLEDLKLDPNIWQRAEVRGGCVPGTEVYLNQKTGVTYEVIEGIVTEVRYNVTEEICKMLSQRAKSTRN